LSFYTQIPVEKVYERIIRTYDKLHLKPFQRPMLIHKSYSAHGQLGAVFFSVNGSPPKGYALYVPKHHYLIIIDAWGKTRRYQNTDVTGLDKFKDDDILKEESKI